MRCNNAVQAFLESEDNCYIPFLVRLHMIFCSSCRNEIRTMLGIFKKAKIYSMTDMPVDMTESIMSRISESNIILGKNIPLEKDTSLEKNISFYRWLFAGVVIFASIFLISYSNSFTWLKHHFGSGLEIPVNIVLGLAITLYAASFIGTHIDEAKKFIKIINSKIH